MGKHCTKSVSRTEKKNEEQSLGNGVKMGGETQDEENGK